MESNFISMTKDKEGVWQLDLSALKKAEDNAIEHRQARGFADVFKGYGDAVTGGLWAVGGSILAEKLIGGIAGSVGGAGLGNLSGAITKLAAAWGINNWAPMNPRAKEFATMFLLYDATLDVIDLSGIITNALAGFGLGQGSAPAHHQPDYSGDTRFPSSDTLEAWANGVR